MAAQQKISVKWDQGKKMWKVEYWWEGKPVRHYTWIVNGRKYRFTRDHKDYADELAQYIRSRLVPNEQGIVTFHPNQIRTGKTPALNSFENYVRTKLDSYWLMVKNGDRQAEYVKSLERFNRDYWSKKLSKIDIRELNKPIVHSFYNWLSGLGLSKKYRQNIMDALKMLVDEAFDDNGLKFPKKWWPDYKVKKGHRKKLPSVLTEEQQSQVIAAVPQKHRAMVMMFFYHGLRPQEIRDLTWDAIDLENSVVKVDTVKGGNDRAILMEPDLVAALKAMPRALHHDHVFHNNGRPYSKTGQWKIIRKALDKVGLSHVRPYDAGRHSAATSYARRGAGAHDIQYILGHADIRTSEIYVHLAVGDQERFRR